jgi:hypothetical protein
MISDVELAWRLVEVARPCLNRRQRQLTFVELGSGDELRAIERILREVNRVRFELPPTAVSSVESWLDRYTDSGFESTFRGLVEGIRCR